MGLIFDFSQTAAFSNKANLVVTHDPRKGVRLYNFNQLDHSTLPVELVGVKKPGYAVPVTFTVDGKYVALGDGSKFTLITQPDISTTFFIIDQLRIFPCCPFDHTCELNIPINAGEPTRHLVFPSTTYKWCEIESRPSR